MLYRRSRAEAPCGSFEIEELMDAGVDWRELVTPVRVLGEERVTGIELLQCRLGEPDATGRRCPLPGEGENVALDVDIVVAAIGEIPTPPFGEDLGLENVRKGEVHWLQMTRIENVFVAGDALTGPSKIGKAVYSGLRAARSLTNWLDLKALHRESEFRSDLIRKEDLR
jgi:glutamate synthase (NADPH/NADH) small chain